MKKIFFYSLFVISTINNTIIKTEPPVAQIVNANDPVIQQQISNHHDEEERIEKLMVSNFANIATNAILAIQTSQQNPENPAATGPFFLNMIQSFLTMIIEAFKTKNIADLAYAEKQLALWCKSVTKEQLEQMLLLIYEQCIDASADFKHVINGLHENQN